MELREQRATHWILTSAVLGTVLVLAVPCGRDESRTTSTDTKKKASPEAPVFFGAWEADPDTTLTAETSSAALSLPGIDTEFVFASTGQFVELPGDRVRISGVLESRHDPSMQFYLAAVFEDVFEPGDAGYPPAAPDTPLADEAYAANGGPADPSAWSYYTSGTGTLTGMASLEGAILTLALDGDAAFRGAGANGKNTRDGFSAAVEASLVQQPTAGLGLPSAATGSLSLDLTDEATHCLSGANGRALWLPGFGDELVFVTGGELLEQTDGTGVLEGVVSSVADPDSGWEIRLELDGRVDPGEVGYPPVGSPKRELPLSSYVENGGPVRPSMWRYYEALTGELTGIGGFAGAVLSVEGWGPAFQVGVGANGRNHGDGASVWIAGQLVAPATTGTALPDFLNQGDLNVELSRECDPCADGACTTCARWANPDLDLGESTSNHALWLPDIATDFRFISGGRLIENLDGTAKLAGVVASLADPSQQLIVDIDFSGRVAPGAPDHPPVESPKQELLPSAYAENGGPVDPSAWWYYTSTSGTLVGRGLFDGALISVERLGPAFQVGVGANGKNGALGASGWITVTVDRRPWNGTVFPTRMSQGDINVDLDGPCDQCAVGSTLDPEFGQSRGPTALWLEGLGVFELESITPFVERPDGTATLSAVARHLTDPTKAWQMDVVLSDRIDPGELRHPPADSPKRGLPKRTYAESGGWIDTRLYHYYGASSGTLTGIEAYDGAVLEVERLGPAFQIGLGANNQNYAYGGSGWLTVEVVSQPAQGEPFSSGLSRGDLYLDLSNECP